MSLLMFLACSAPPPAPEGLDASTAYAFREFYRSDAYFEAGVAGFMNWFYTEGYTLVGVSATTENTDSFTITGLTLADVSHLPVNVTEESLSRAAGVVSLAEMDCNWREAEALLLRSDQHVIFDTFATYSRQYLGDRSAYEDASSASAFAEVNADLSADAALLSPYPDVFLQTLSRPDPANTIVVDIEPYDLHLDFRHGLFELPDEAGEQVPTHVVAIITWIEAPALNASGELGMLQTYSVELNIERPGDKTLRMLAVWTEPLGLDPESALTLNLAVNTSLDASEQISKICAGEVEIPAEP